MPSRAPAESKLPDALYKAMQGVMDTLFAQTDGDGRDISEVFHDLIPKRSFPDYYKVIKNPQAMNPVQNAIKKKSYTTFSAFVRECAQIFYNAKYYNISGSQIYEDAVTLEGVLESELRKLKNQGIISEEETKLPDFGPIPPPSDAGSQGSPDAEEDSPAEDDDEDDEEEDSKRRSRRRRTTKREATLEDDDEAGKKEADQRRKRGRPPRVDTPMECRIKNIMKGLRKCKDEDGNLRVNAFEKLPDAKQYPDYYQEIKNPIALDNMRKRIKRREYRSVEQFEADVRLMCDNAKIYNVDGTQIFNDAVALLEELSNLAEAEKARDDSEFQGGGIDLRSGQGKDKQMRIPLKSIDHNGETYVIGDWVHITNRNDLSKPIVAQIYRTWEDTEGRKWINACWYYRPEQTVHRHDRKFYEHEVVKTGQYRDHEIEEVVGKCFVMFFTRYSRGRPKGIGHRQVYVCESRYNEVEKHFNKIKTWKSCIPDEVRSQDYEIDAFEKPEPLRKFPSPIAHLLPPNATEDDPLPDAKMGEENAPPIVGAVFKRRKGAYDSPPPEPTPPPQSSTSGHQTATSAVKATPAPARPPSTDYHENLSMTQMYKQAASLTPASQQPPQPPVPATPTPQMHHRPPPQHIMQTPMVPQYSQQGHNTPMRQGSVHQPYTPTPIPHSQSPHMYQQHHHVIPQSHPPPQMYPNQQPYPHQPQMPPQAIHPQMPHHPGLYGAPPVQHPQYAPPPTAHMHQYPQQYPVHHPQPQPQLQYAPQMTHQHRGPTQTPMPQPPPNAYYPPQLPPSTFTLPESTTSGIPESIAEQFLRDEEGRILWFTVPPLETPAAAATTHATAPTANFMGVGPSHSLEYLARRHELLVKKRKRREEREKELRQTKRQREVERNVELIGVKGALGKALKALGKQLKI